MTAAATPSISQKELMASIREHWDAAIEEATAASSVPPAFLAALIANESGGKNEAQRFEPAVFEHLKEVLLGTRPHFAPAGIKRPLMKSDLLAYCAPGSADAPRADFDSELQTLHNLATSWGLTQIMGWHLVEFQSGLGVSWLATPGGNLQFATRLLAWFAEHYQLDLSADFDPLLHCWNAGEPGNPTFDPQYVPNGLARLELYRELAVQS
jgi:Transglycosylase SLT domain